MRKGKKQYNYYAKTNHSIATEVINTIVGITVIILLVIITLFHQFSCSSSAANAIRI